MFRWLFLTLVLTATTARGDAPAAVTIRVPAGATLTIDGHRTGQLTAVRQFVSPPLREGKVFVYTFRASYTWFGVPKTKERTLDVEAGARYELDMTEAADVPVEKPKPAPPIEWTPPVKPKPPVVEPPPKPVEPPPPPVEPPPPMPMPRKVVEEPPPPPPAREPAPSPRPTPERKQYPILPEPRPDGPRKPDDSPDESE